LDAIGRYDATTLLEKALPVLEEAHRTLANNVANANTPGFSPTHIAFEESLRQALASGGRGSVSLKTTHLRHIVSEPRRAGLVFERDTLELGRNDKSKFSIDKEMVEITKNSGRFQVFSTMLTKRYRQIREVLRMP
jgi:flagellar basal-body rod protein FlgB